MKKIISLVVLTTLFFSCQKDSQLVSDSYTSIKPASFMVQSPAVRPIICETWKIGEFIVNGKDIVSEFQSITFDFCSSNAVYASGGIMISGKWNYEQKAVSTFTMAFEIPEFAELNTAMKFGLLNETWQVVEMTNYYMRLNFSYGKMNKQVYFKKI